MLKHLQHNSSKLLTVVYATLSLFAVSASSQALFLPRWPRSNQLSSAFINSILVEAGYSPTSLPSLPAHRSYDIATSPVIKVSLDDGTELFLVNAHVRERLNFKTDYISKLWKELDVKKADTLFNPFPFKKGVIDNSTAIQSCLVPRQGFGLSFEQLSSYVDQNAAGSFYESFKRWVSFHPSRSYQCILMTLRSTSNNVLTLSHATSLFQTLQNALSSDDYTPFSDTTSH